jgi:Protein of unknown function (DUF1045)
MQMSAVRYAIYLAPPPDTPLWTFGSRVLGYDAVTGEDVQGFAPPGFDVAQWRLMTERPRIYGFHATLKAPFRLAADIHPAELEGELSAFCETQAAFDLGPLAVSTLMQDERAQDSLGFVALTPIRNCPELVALEARTVSHFDRFRAPLSDQELQKRKPETLTARQRLSLDRFGYPYTGPDYRFHMTLSGITLNAAQIADTLADAMAKDIGTGHLNADALVLFRQDHPQARFRVVRRFDLPGTAQG